MNQPMTQRARPSKPDIITYGDHEVITPDTRTLRATVRAATPSDDDPVTRAEAALTKIAGEFGVWMAEECDRLHKARLRVHDDGLDRETRQELFLAAHDVKGDAPTFGFGAAASAADSLCRLLEHAPDLERIPTNLIDQHVDAVRAIVREHARPDIAAIATALSERLRQVTDEFLIHENQARPEHLQAITGLPVAAGEIL